MANRPVGLWMLPPHVGTSRSMFATLQRDFARLRTLNHPHIARMLELGNNGQQYYVTGERLDGEPLREVLTHLAPERVEIGEADDIVRAIGSALVYAHEHGVAHGDVRAENVLITMDRRVLLTNFLARRVAKTAARPPRAADDLKGIARLAAELYTGSTSLEALRTAAHGTVPAARLNAIRGVLEPSGRRYGSVAEFLTAAGLSFAGPTATSTVRQAPRPQRSWSLWRVVLPLAAAAAIATFVASYQAGVGVSAEEIKVRGVGALRAIAARVAPPSAPEAKQPEVEPEPPLQRTVAVDSAGATEAAPLDGAPAPGAPPPDARPAPMTPAVPEPAPTADGSDATQSEPAVVSLGVPKIAAREDHSVVAIDILRSGDTTHEATVAWWTTPDTAHQDDDYVDVGRRAVTFPAGATVERVLIPLVNDGRRESSEAFTVHVGRPNGGVAGSVTTTRVTLHDDD
jgi:hypothetical protein